LRNKAGTGRSGILNALLFHCGDASHAAMHNVLSGVDIESIGMACSIGPSRDIAVL
jgi:hypothetical protein